VNRLCALAGVSRAGYYRFRRRRPASADSMDLRNEIQQIALRWPAYGYRRIHAELVRGDWKVNHKCVLRLMRIDNLLCVRRRKFILTTDSGHSLPIYPNLAKGLVLNRTDQLWVADITYIGLQLEFIYLAVLLDAFSRRCIGWALQRSLEAAWRWKPCAWRSGNAGPSPAWCITPIAVCNMLRTTTPGCCNSTMFASA
jgi:putative transposase